MMPTISAAGRSDSVAIWSRSPATSASRPVSAAVSAAPLARGAARVSSTSAAALGAAGTGSAAASGELTASRPSVHVATPPRAAVSRPRCCAAPRVLPSSRVKGRSRHQPAVEPGGDRGSAAVPAGRGLGEPRRPPTGGSRMSHSGALPGLRYMRLAVLGATGHTGRHVLDFALGHGHDVTAFVRSPGKLTPAERLTIVAGDPLQPASLAAALDRKSVV